MKSERDDFAEIEQQLVDGLSEEINEEVLFKITGMNKEERVIHIKRQEKINDILDEDKQD